VDPVLPAKRDKIIEYKAKFINPTIPFDPVRLSPFTAFSGFFVVGPGGGLAFRRL
jgi:hypothetical protein